MIRIVAASVLSMFIAAPLSAQVPVYTNKPIAKTSAPRHQITPEEYQSLLAHQFVYVPTPDPQRESLPPSVTIANDTPPVVLQPPIYMMPYNSWEHRSYGYSFGYGGKTSHRSERSGPREPAVRPRETHQPPTQVSTPAVPRQTPRPIGLTIRK
jgi:hypothetical protein